MNILTWVLAAVCTALGFVGSWYVGNKKVIGYFLCLMALIGWIIYDVIVGQWTLIVFPTAINLVICIRNLVKRLREIPAEPQEAIVR